MSTIFYIMLGAFLLKMSPEYINSRLPTFSSTYSETKGENCLSLDEIHPNLLFNEGSDIPTICRGFGGYQLYIYYNLYGHDIITVESIDSTNDFSIILFSDSCGESLWYGEKIEWRLADGKPFACIIRVTCLEMHEKMDEELGIMYDYWEDEEEFLIIAGLDGNEHINGSINTRTTKNSNELARKFADKGYLIE